MAKRKNRADRRIADMTCEEVHDSVIDACIRDMRDWYPHLEREHLYINYAANLLAERHLKEALGIHPEVDRAVADLVAGLLEARPGIEAKMKESDERRKADWALKKAARLAQERAGSPQ